MGVKLILLHGAWRRGLALITLALATACTSSAPPPTTSASAPTTAAPPATVPQAIGAPPVASGASRRARVAALFAQFVNQGNWDVAGFHAYDAMCNKYSFDCTYVEQATYEKAPAILTDFATQGYDMIITHSSGYGAAIEEVAPRFPKTQFVLFSYAKDTNGIQNYSAWSVNWDQVGFVVGFVAALASKTSHIAYIGGEKLPTSDQNVAAYRAGAQQVNPTIKFTVTFIGSFTDAAKAKQVALQEINAGADVLIPGADTADAGTQQAAEEGNALTFGEYMDERPKYPNGRMITSFVVDMDRAYDEIGDAFRKGTLNGEIRQMGLETKALTFTEFEHVDPSVGLKARQLMDELAAGTIKPS